MTLILVRKSPKTGVEIGLHDIRNQGWPYEPTDRYELECRSHGMTSDTFSTKTAAIKAMKHSDDWCIGCSEGWEIEE